MAPLRLCLIEEVDLLRVGLKRNYGFVKVSP